MKQSAPLSRSQYGLYVECMTHQGEPCYNLPYIYVLDGSLDADRLCRAIETALTAHPVLFSHITTDAQGEPLLTLDTDEVKLHVEVEPIQDIEAEKAQLVQPFDLGHDRLFHVRLMRDAAHFYYFIDLHHIVADGTSMQLLLRDIDAAPVRSVVLGDFNDNPLSYTYFRLLRGRKDSFVQAGKGFGATYRALWPLLRIDYILYPQDLEAVTYRMPKARFSDHYPIIATYSEARPIN